MLAGMPALVYAGLESSSCLNFDGDSRRMRAYALGATGDRSINSCADSRRMRAYTRAYARLEYKPGLTVPVVAIYDSVFFHALFIVHIYLCLQCLIPYSSSPIICPPVDANLHYVFNHYCVCSSLPGGLHASGQL